ncbi:MAG: prephenate dehydrogenase/arogenate dehydrogenase family protein [Gammaproteobacteria bacterium]|nr:prephenate dehydrogenase/arogenate dehydrogenase family protein [Gammaproteobacteria bacterium]
MKKVRSKRLCIIGVGLIGGSLARAVREKGLYHEIIGCGRSVANLERAVELGIIDNFEQDIGKAVNDCDMVVVAVPLGAFKGVFEQMKDHLPDTAVVTDVGSAKQSVIEDAKKALGNAYQNFVPGHPIAGTEKSGAEASFAELFQERRVILTPTDDTSVEAVARVRAMWECTGAEVIDMEPAHHDEVLAATSHLPHVLAYTLVDTLAAMSERDEIFQYAAGGFRDFTRIASSDPAMWRDICIANRDAIMKVLGQYQRDLTALSQAILNNDESALFELFSRAKQARDRSINSD